MDSSLVLLICIVSVAIESISTERLTCIECKDDDCNEMISTVCDKDGVKLNMLALRDIYKDIRSRQTEDYECLKLVYKDIDGLESKKMNACVESGFDYCNSPTKDDVKFLKCDSCDIETCEATETLKETNPDNYLNPVPFSSTNTIRSSKMLVHIFLMVSLF